jgi:hypothetical protein
MKAYKVMTEVINLSMVKKRDVFLWHSDEGIFNCTVSVHCDDDDKEREVFELLRTLPEPNEIKWNSYKAKPNMDGFTCLTLRYGSYKVGEVDIQIFFDDVQ